MSLGCDRLLIRICRDPARPFQSARRPIQNKGRRVATYTPRRPVRMPSRDRGRERASEREKPYIIKCMDRDGRRR